MKGACNIVTAPFVVSSVVYLRLYNSMMCIVSRTLISSISTTYARLEKS